MAELIETRRVREVIARIKSDTERRRNDAVQCPPLGSIYTAMAFGADEIIGQLEAMLAGHVLTVQPTQPAEGE